MADKKEVRERFLNGKLESTIKSNEKVTIGSTGVKEMNGKGFEIVVGEVTREDLLKLGAKENPDGTISLTAYNDYHTIEDNGNKISGATKKAVEQEINRRDTERGK